MPDGISYGSGQAFQPTLAIPRSDQLSQQSQQLNVKQTAAVAETVQRQAEFSSNRAESLARQAEKLENRVQTEAEDGVGAVVDVSV